MYKDIFARFPRKHILVIGDLILDKYIQGDVSRISPEAPVPIVLEKNSFCVPGGAANVAHNLKAMGAEVTLIGRVGADPEGKILKQQLHKRQLDTRDVFVDRRLPTIHKIRVIAQHQQVVRIDREDVLRPGNPGIHKKILGLVAKNIGAYHAVVLSDYGKGLITPELVSFINGLCRANKIILAVDPKVEHFGYYQNVTAITPNLKETENAIRNIKITSKSGKALDIHTDKLSSDRDILRAGTELLNYLELDALLITLGERGMQLFEKGKKPVSIKTVAKEVFDVTGAGDAVISAFTLSLAAGASKRQAAEIANFAGGIVVGKMGAAAVTREELTRAIKERSQ